MHLPMLLIMALAGVGCENKLADASDPGAQPTQQVQSPAIPSFQQSAYPASSDSGWFPSNPYPEIPSHLYAPPVVPHSGDWHAAMRSTVWSFVLGHDPDVSNVREIEASIYSVEYGR